MMRYPKFLAVLACVSAGSLFATTTAQATTVQIVNDNFNGTSPAETSGDDAFVPLDVAWSRIQPSASAPVIGSGQLGDTGSSAKFRGMIGLLPSAFTLTNTGDAIELEADFRSNNAPVLPSVADGYRIGLFSSSTGYFMDIGVQNTGSLTLEEDIGGPNLAGNNANSVVRASVASGAPAITTNSFVHVKLTLTKTATGVQIDADYDNGAHTLSYLDTTPVTTVDRIFFGTGDHSVDYWVDNVTVETTVIPEPGSLALLGLGGLLIARRRRA